MNLQLISVTPKYVPEWYEATHDLLEAAVARSGGRYVLADILARLLKGQMQMWVIRDQEGIQGVGITTITDFPQIRECRVLAATGDNGLAWPSLIQQIEAWAKSLGCQVCVVECRPGWEKPMKPYGYQKTHVLLEKRLEYVH